jgi:hypothetical protein
LAGPAPAKAQLNPERRIVPDDVMAQFAQMCKCAAALHGLINNAQAYAPRHSAGAVIAPTIDRI